MCISLDDYAALKQAAEERKGWRYSGMMSDLLYSRGEKKKNHLSKILRPYPPLGLI